MRISRVAAMAVLSAVLSVPASAVAEDAPSTLADSFCFPRPYGGYMLHSTLPDGSLRLTAEVGSRASGRRWGLELVMRPDEVHRVWEEAIKQKLTPAEISALLPYCRSDNKLLEKAWQKDAFNRTLPRRSSLDKAIWHSVPGVPMREATALEITPEERQALQAFHGDAAAAAALTKLKADAFIQVHQLFLPIAQERARHIPYVEQDHYDEATRRAFKVPSAPSQSPGAGTP